MRNPARIKVEFGNFDRPTISHMSFIVYAFVHFFLCLFLRADWKTILDSFSFAKTDWTDLFWLYIPLLMKSYATDLQSLCVDNSSTLLFFSFLFFFFKYFNTNWPKSYVVLFNLKKKNAMPNVQQHLETARSIYHPKIMRCQ